MRQCLCSDSPRFTRKPIPPLCLLAPPSLFPPLFLHFSSSLHFFFRPSLYTFLSFFSLLGEGMAVSPQKKHLLCTEMRVLPELEATPPPAFLISVSVSTSPLSPSTCNSNRAPPPCSPFRVLSLFNGHLCLDFFFLPSSFRHLSSAFTSPLLLPRLPESFSPSFLRSDFLAFIFHPPPPFLQFVLTWLYFNFFPSVTWSSFFSKFSLLFYFYARHLPCFFSLSLSPFFFRQRLPLPPPSAIVPLLNTHFLPASRFISTPSSRHRHPRPSLKEIPRGFPL